MQKKVLLIGSNGFIGKALSAYLKKYYLIYKINRKVVKENSRNVCCDISKIKELKKKVTNFPNFEYVINLSGQIQKNKSKMHKSIFVGNKNIIECFKHSESTLIYFSTTLVYGHSNNYSNPTSPLRPHSDYAKIKVKTENLYKNKAKNFLILRIGNVYDNKLEKKGLLKNLIHAIKNNKIISVNRMQSVRNYIHANDLIRIVKIIMEKSIINKTLNIGHQNISNKHMIKNFEKIFKKILRVEDYKESCLSDPSIKINPNVTIKKFKHKFKNTIEDTIKLNK